MVLCPGLDDTSQSEKDSIYNCTRATSVNEIIQDTPASMLSFRW